MVDVKLISRSGEHVRRRFASLSHRSLKGRRRLSLLVGWWLLDRCGQDDHDARRRGAPAAFTDAYTRYVNRGWAWRVGSRESRSSSQLVTLIQAVIRVEPAEHGHDPEHAHSVGVNWLLLAPIAALLLINADARQLRRRARGQCRHRFRNGGLHQLERTAGPVPLTPSSVPACSTRRRVGQRACLAQDDGLHRRCGRRRRLPARALPDHLLRGRREPTVVRDARYLEDASIDTWVTAGERSSFGVRSPTRRRCGDQRRTIPAEMPSRTAAECSSSRHSPE